MGLKTAKNYLDAYKKDNAIQYINVCTFLELLVDFEQSNLGEILAYLKINSFPTTTTLYKKSQSYINPKGDNENDSQNTRYFFDDIEENAVFSVVTGFSHDICKKYQNYYFSLLEVFQSHTLQQISFTEKYAANEAMGRGFCYVSKCSIGSLFKPNDLVTGLPQKRINELIANESIAKVEIDSRLNLLKIGRIQKEAMIKIHEYLDTQQEAYNFTSTHSDELTDFFNAQSRDIEPMNNDKIGKPIINQTRPKSDKELVVDLKDQLRKVSIELAAVHAGKEQVIIDDEPTHHKSVGSMQALVTTLIKMAEYDKEDLADPFGELNKLIQAKAEVLGLSVKKDFIAKWLKKADNVL